MSQQIQGFQLSPQQKRLWLLQKNSSAYRAICAIVIEGSLQIDILKIALEKLVNKYEILRTSFYKPRGIKIPIQVVQNNPTLSLIEQAWNQKDFLSVEIDKYLQELKQQDIGWESNSLLRTVLIKRSPQEYIVLVSLPSLCADSASLNSLVGELSSCYSACLLKKQLPDEPLQYADIAAWQNELVEAEEAISGRQYWQQLDISAVEKLQLCFERRVTEERNFQPQYLRLPISSDLVNKIEVIAQQYQSSTDILFLTCWLILLGRLTGQSKPIIGLGCDGRNYEELKTAIGLFAKYLPFTCELAASHRFDDILTKVKNYTTELTEWQESFTWESGEAMEQPFFPFCFDFQPAPTLYAVSDISLTIEQQYVCVDRFKVKLVCDRTWDNSVNAEFHYDTNLFCKEDIQRLASQWYTLLNNVIENPSAPISQLNILSQQERQQLLINFNNTKTAELQYECIHHWLEQQCNSTPDNIAVVFEDQQLTYRELNTRANQLAHYLQQLGVNADVLVGLCIERMPLMLIALLAILKAGGAYVPIDPSYPLERKAFILADTQMPILLTQQHLAADLPTNKTQVICLNTEELISQQPIHNPISQATKLNLAYIIYTSGSTGKPKGTMIPHEGLINYLTWCTQTYAVDQGIGTLVHSPIGFDLTITSLFSPLLVGKRVELLPENQDIETLAQALRQSNNLSLVKITPAHLELLKGQLSPQEAAGRARAFIIGGENLTAQNIAFWQEFAPDTILVNEYGPTETVVGCCIYQVPNSQHHTGSISIGTPIANTQLYVLDQNLQPLPIGVPGELYIGGKGVARGYFNRPDLTAQKFIPHPFSDEPGERLYKTGDLVSHRLDGTLEFLGRSDNQVKLRGFRIELEEIEAALLEHPDIKESAVIVREDIPGDQRLVAYIVLNQESSFSINQLREFLKAKLPEYMVPSVFVPLKALPLTNNGKIDRKALPAPDKVRPEQAGLFVAPRNATEKQLTEIWAEILRLDRIGIYDNFFNLGGHSLLATQLISRVRDTFQAELVVKNIFEAPTVADLAALVTQKLAEQADEELLAATLAELDLISQH
ncbi:MAG: amino acid adenylation domain-containing protein [Hassallia sp. WJT32-NPBG1]|jgi:amino acid adenylation domain-containing protein|nr:amino acid adenylation domain-containing protein [Hassallia sp. WJT32-NPBG1]